MEKSLKPSGSRYQMTGGRTVTLSKKCPRCRSTDTARSHRKPAERLLLGLRPYRCNKCQRRFYCLFPSRQTHA